MKRITVCLILTATLIPLALLSSGCTSTTGPSFTRMSTPDNKALVYVYRLKTNSKGGLKSYVVEANGRKIATLFNDSYSSYVTRPGLTDFRSRTEYTSSAKKYLEAGQTYYLRLDVKKGALVGRPDLKFVGAGVGEREIAVCKLTGE